MAISDKGHAVQGKDIINQLSIFLRTGHFHNIENNAVLETIIKLRNSINPFVECEGFLRIDLVGEFFYVNDTRIRYPLEFLLNFDYITGELRKRQIGSVSFLSPLEITDIKIFLSAFIRTSDSPEPFHDMNSFMRDTKNITISKLKKIESDDNLSRRRIVKRSYFNAVSFTRGVMKSVQTGESVNLKKAKRTVESMVDSLLSEEQLLVGMTSIKDYDEYTYHHSVNVSILSIAIGQRIGLNRRNITALGIAALFHDLGKTEIPNDVLNKPSLLNKEEWKIMHKHPFWGALSILRLKGIDEISMQNAIVAFQHHMNYDLSGYPKPTGPMDLSFYSRIISVADQYDAMTSLRVYMEKPLSPDKALSVMMEKSGKEIDPVLLKFFINMVGKYPIGSLVLLDSRELGLVCEGNHTVAERPRVKVLVDNSGNRVDGPVVDLTDTDSSGTLLRTIVKTLDPKEYGISLAEYLL